MKTGFRHALGGYGSIAGVKPDLSVFGKAIANGYPMAALGGRADLMQYFVHPQKERRVLLAGTYNAHPVPVAAAIATIERLRGDGGAVYQHLERLGALMERGARELLASRGICATISRQGSAFCIYFMDHCPRDWHDVAANHDFARDAAMRKASIDKGVYFFPLATKQCSISAAHTEGDIQATLDVLAQVVAPQ